MFDRVLSSSFAKGAFAFWQKHEHLIGSGALLTGFCFDLVFANRPDSPANNILLLCYIFVAGGLIIALNVHKSKQFEQEHPVEPLFLLTVLQFLFGNLSSNLLVLYGRSGTFAGSALFLGILFFMLVGNEFLKTRYGQLRFNIAVYYLLVFSYLMIAVPTFVLHRIGVIEFLISGAASLLYIGLFLAVVYVVVLRGKLRKKYLFEVGLNVFAVFSAFNLLYFLNIIPPVPLGLKEIGIYHSVGKVSGGYAVTYEAPAWFAFWRATSPVYHADNTATAHCFSSVFAPTGLSTPVVHSWEYFDAKKNDWVTAARVSFAISGGRDGGYRGYSEKTISKGKWRCDVETESGALIGRAAFTVVSGDPSTALSSKTF